jgi:methionyl aminopeptidase
MTNQQLRKISSMTEGGKKLGAILEELFHQASVGVSLLDIEIAAKHLIQKAGGTPSFVTVPGYKWATCLCVNDEVVHGIPKRYILQDGDVLTIDIGMLYKGYHTDTAWTRVIRAKTDSVVDKKIREFLSTGEKALWEAVQTVRVGNRVGHISGIIQHIIESAGFHVVKSLVGHGVGKQLHEPPQIPGYVRGSINRTTALTEGLTIAIEVIYSSGNGNIWTDYKDGWTIRTKDKSLSAVFEHTVVVLKNGSMVLTKAN